MVFVANPKFKITSIKVVFTENLMYRDEYFGLDFYLGGWMGSTEFRKTQLPHHNYILFEPSNEEDPIFTVDLTGYDDGVSNILPVMMVGFDVELKTRSSVLVSSFDVKFFQLALGVSIERTVRISSDSKLELAQVVITGELDGYEVHHFDTDLPRFDRRSVVDDEGGVSKSNTYRVCCEPHHTIAWSNDICISHGKVGISHDGKIYGGVGGSFDQVTDVVDDISLEIVSVFVSSIIVDNGSLHVPKPKTFRKKHVDEFDRGPKAVYTMKLTIEAYMGEPASLVIVDGSTGEMIFTQAITEGASRYGEIVYSRKCKTFQYEITGVEHGTVVDVILQTNVAKRKVANRAMESMRMRGVSGKSLDSDDASSASSSMKQTQPAFVSASPYNSYNRYAEYAAAEVRYVSAEIIKITESSRKKDHILRPVPKPLKQLVQINNIPLRNTSAKMKLIRPLSPSAAGTNLSLNAEMVSTSDFQPATMTARGSPGMMSARGSPVMMTARGGSPVMMDTADVINSPLRCQIWKPHKEMAAHNADESDTWDQRQLQAFRLFHKRCAVFINATYGYDCCVEFMMRAQDLACRECRESNKLLDRELEQEHTAEDIILKQLGYAVGNSPAKGTSRPSSPSDHDSDGNVLFPVFCLKHSCARLYMYIYRSQLYLTKLTHGLVGENAGWILKRSKTGFDWGRWIERDKGYARKQAAIEFNIKKKIYDQPWVEKWVCPDCGEPMPYNEDDELRREIDKLKQLNVMLGDLETWSEDEQDDHGINFTTMKVSKDVWCIKCKEKYRPKHTWNAARWEEKMKHYAKIKNSNLMTLREEVAKAEERARKRATPQVSSWWQKHLREKERQLQQHMMKGTVPTIPEQPLIEFAFTGSPFKFSDTSNLGGTLWQRLASLKTAQDMRMALFGVANSTVSNNAAVPMNSTPGVVSNKSAVNDAPSTELDGMGEGYCIESSQATKVSTRLDWNISKSNGALRFMLDSGCSGLTDVYRAKQLTQLDTAVENQLLSSYLMRAVVSLRSAGDPAGTNNNSLLLEDHFSDSQGKSITEEYSQLINQEGSFANSESILRAYAITAGMETIPLLIEVIMLIPQDNEVMERGNFSVGMAFNAVGKGLDGANSINNTVCMFGKDIFSWGICEDIQSHNHQFRAFPSLRFDNKELLKNFTNSLNNSKFTSSGENDYSDNGVTFAVYERGRKLYTIPPILPGDKVRILLDPCTGRMTISVLSLPPTNQYEGPLLTSRSGVSINNHYNVNSNTQLYEDTFIGRHHTFRVPVAPLDCYDIGCTLNVNQNICLLNSIHQDRKSASFPTSDPAKVAESIVSRIVTPAAKSSKRGLDKALESIIAANAALAAESQPQVAAAETGGSIVETSRANTTTKMAPAGSAAAAPEDAAGSVLAPVRAIKSTLSTRGPSLGQLRRGSTEIGKVLGTTSSPSIFTSDGTKIDQQKLTELTAAAASQEDAAMKMLTAAPSQYNGTLTDFEKPSMSKFVSRRRNAMSSLGIHSVSHPELIDRSDSDCAWCIGVPGVIPEGAFADGGLVSLELDEKLNSTDEDDDNYPCGIFSKDENREVFIVRIAYAPPTKPKALITGAAYASLSKEEKAEQAELQEPHYGYLSNFVNMNHHDFNNKEEKAEKALKGLTKWAVGYCVRGSGRQAQAIWISKNNGELNKIRLIATNPNISSGRIQYLMDSNLSLYKWKKGLVYAQESSHGKGKKSKENVVAEEYFAIPKHAVQVVNEFVGDWEIIQYAVRTEVEGCIWPGVYFKHIFHNLAESAVPTAGEWEMEEVQKSTVGIKHVRPSRVATKLPQVREEDREKEHMERANMMTSDGADPSRDNASDYGAARQSRKSSRKKSSKSGVRTEKQTEEEMAWSLAKDFILSEATKLTSHENAIFAFMGQIREVHVSQVEFLCHMHM
jgi:hypothetical protein